MEHLTTFRRPWRCRTLLALIAVLSGGGCYVESESPLDRRDGTDTDEATESSASGVDETGSVDAANEDSGIVYRPPIGDGDEADVDCMQAAVGLIWRALVLWLFLILLATIASWF